MAISGIRGYDPLALQRTNRSMPNLTDPSKFFGLDHVDNYAEQNAIRHWSVSVNSPKLGLGTLIDIRA